MRVREIYWYRSERELRPYPATHLIGKSILGILDVFTWYVSRPDVQVVTIIDTSIRTSREELERLYLEWKAQNEG